MREMLQVSEAFIAMTAVIEDDLFPIPATLVLLF